MWSLSSFRSGEEVDGGAEQRAAWPGGWLLRRVVVVVGREGCRPARRLVRRRPVATRLRLALLRRGVLDVEAEDRHALLLEPAAQLAARPDERGDRCRRVGAENGRDAARAVRESDVDVPEPGRTKADPRFGPSLPGGEVERRAGALDELLEPHAGHVHRRALGRGGGPLEPGGSGPDDGLRVGLLR